MWFVVRVELCQGGNCAMSSGWPWEHNGVGQCGGENWPERGLEALGLGVLGGVGTPILQGTSQPYTFY